MMEEEVMEELKKLETQNPNRFECLKNELRSIIIQLQSKKHDSQQMFSENNHFDTQESTCLVQKKRRNNDLELDLAEKVVIEGKIDEGSEPESPRTVIVKDYSSGKNKRKDRVDLVLERAQACLKKIRCLKISLLSPPSSKI